MPYPGKNASGDQRRDYEDERKELQWRGKAIDKITVNVADFLG